MKSLLTLKKNNSFFDFTVKIIISLFPIFFVSGPFLTDLFCTIIGLIFLYLIIREKKWEELHLNYFFYYFILIFLYLNLNSFFSFDKHISFSKSLPFIRIVLFIFALNFFLYRYKEIYRYFFYNFVIILSLLFLDALVQFFFNHNIFGFETVYGDRISSFFGDELIMGSYVSRILPIIIGISFLVNNKYLNLINLILITISGLLVYLSGERLATFYFITFIVFYLIFNKKYIVRFLIIFLGISILTNIYNTASFGRIFEYTIEQFKQTKSITSYRHSLHYKTAYDMFEEKKLFGHGLKSFRYKCSEKKYEDIISNKIEEDKLKFLEKHPKSNEVDLNFIIEYKNGCNTHPHNIYFEFLAEIGFIGFLLFGLIFIYTTIKLTIFSVQNIFKKTISKIDMSKNLILFGIFIQMFPLVPSGSFFNNYMLIIFFISVGFYLSINRVKNE